MLKLLSKKINKKYFFAILFFLFFLLSTVVFAQPSIDLSTDGSTGSGNPVYDALLSAFIWIVGWFWYFTALMFQVSAAVFDNLLIISLNSNLLDLPFIKVVWVSLRDFANTVFVLGGVYLALTYMLGFGRGTQKNIILLIVSIFAINFSLFATRLVIDAGNLTAHVFYAPMATEVKTADGKNADSYFSLATAVYKNYDKQVKPSDFRSVGMALYTLINPDKGDGAANDPNDFLKTVKDNKGKEVSMKLKERYLITAITLIIVYFFFAKEFFLAGFMFIGRLAGLMYLMISSPIWFAAIFIPDYGWGWFKSKWLVPIFKKSFCIVVYLFFLWLALLILSSDLVKSIDSIEGFGGEGSKEILGWVMTILLKIVFAFVLMKKARTLGADFCEGDFGSTFGHIMKPVGAIAGAAMTLAFPARALMKGATRRAIGSAGQRLSNAKWVKNMYSGEGKMGKVPFSRFVGGRMILAGKGMQDAKIFGMSDRDAQNKRIETLQEIEDSLSESQREKLRRERYKKLSHENVEGFSDEEKDSKYQEHKKNANDESLSESDRNKAREEADKMVATAKIGDMAISEEALNKGLLGGLGAALIPALAAERNRARETNEGARAAYKENKKIKELKEKSNQVNSEKVDSDNAVEKDTVRLKDTFSNFTDEQKASLSKYMENLEEGQKINEGALLTTGMFTSGEIKELQKHDKKIITEISRTLDQNSGLVSGLTENKDDSQKKFDELKKEQRDIGVQSEQANMLAQSLDKGDLTSSEIKKIKKMGGDAYRAELENLETQKKASEENIEKLERELKDSAGNIDVEKQKEKISKEKEKLIKSEEEIVKKSKEVLKKKRYELADKKSGIKSDLEKAEKELKEAEGKLKKVTDKVTEEVSRSIKASENKRKAINKANADYQNAIIKTKIQQREKEKSNAIAKAKKGDIGTVTSADAEGTMV